MPLSRFDRLEILLEQAGSLGPDERAAFIARETTGDPDLHAELTRLLDASQGAAEYVTRLREELLGSGMEGMLRNAAAAEGEDRWVGRTVSHYDIRERIGGGGMGVIYRAHDARLDRTVALKFIAPEIRTDAAARERFAREARAASALDHPNICTIHDVGETDDGRQFIVMAAYDGETLRSRLSHNPLGLADALEVTRQVARALAAAHERGIVHRDVKPDNIFLTRTGVVKLLDFGLAGMADPAGTCSLEGTVAYMSPEQARGGPVDARADVWATGVILYELLAGRRPFQGAGAREVLERIQSADPDFTALGESPPPLVVMVRRALSRDPASRYADAGELLTALERATSGRRRRLAIGVLGVLALAGVAVFSQDTSTAVAPGSVSHVLWVDDNPENNAEVIRALEARGIRVTTALSTADAVQRFDPAVHKFVISDMGRYEGEGGAYVERAGLSLLSQLKARHSGLKLVYCTSARAVETYRGEVAAAGALGIVENCTEAIGLLGF